MFPKEGKKRHQGPDIGHGDAAFRSAIAGALRRELGSTHQTVKTVMRWTGASERTVKHWLAATHEPRGRHLIALARHSDGVLVCFLRAAHRQQIAVGLRWLGLRALLVELLEAMDGDDG